MNSIDVYIDESEDASHGRFVVAGYASSTDEWLVFDRRWRERLRAAGISHCHMKKFKSSRSSLFKHLSREAKAALLADLIAIIRDHVWCGAVSSVNPREYDGTTTQDFRATYGGPYYVALAGCLWKLSEGCEKRGTAAEGGLGVILESGHKAVDQGLLLLREHQSCEEADRTPFKIRSVSSAGKLDVGALQAADILAHCGMTGRDRFSAVVLDALSTDGGVPCVVLDWSAEHFAKLVAYIAQDEEERAIARDYWHQVRRFFGNINVAVRNVPGGVEIDGRNARVEITDEEIRKMLERDPSISLIFRDELAD